MEFVLDLGLLRGILDSETRLARSQVAAQGIRRAFAHSQERHDQRIAAAADVDTLACRQGCAWCCHFSIDVRAVEVFGLLDELERAVGAGERERVLARIRANAAALRGLTAEMRVSRNVQCPFLGDGRCLVYAARPQSCRNYHATDAQGCRRSFEEPDNLDIDPEFAPAVYQAGAAHVEAFCGEMQRAGFDARVYELNAALAVALDDPQARSRFEARAEPFPGLAGWEVEPEFDDLIS